MKTDAKIATITLNPAIDQTVAIPNFSAGSVNRVQDFRCDAGGKGVNVAAFSRLRFSNDGHRFSGAGKSPSV